LYGCALKAIDKFVKNQKNLTAEGVSGAGGLLEQLLDLKRDIFVDAKWNCWVENAKALRLQDFPSSDSPF